MRKLILIIALCTVYLSVFGQEKVRNREIGLNMTELVSLFVPFKGPVTASGPFAFFYRTGGERRFLNFELGARVDSEDFSSNFINIQLGYLTKRSLGEKLRYISSTNVIASVGHFNVPGSVLDGNDNAALGISFTGGVEYDITERLFVATEIHFVLAFGARGTAQFLPPVGLFLGARL